MMHYEIHHCFFLLYCVNAILDKILGQAHTEESKLNLLHYYYDIQQMFRSRRQ